MPSNVRLFNKYPDRRVYQRCEYVDCEEYQCHTLAGKYRKRQSDTVYQECISQSIGYEIILLPYIRMLSVRITPHYKHRSHKQRDRSRQLKSQHWIVNQYFWTHCCNEREYNKGNLQEALKGYTFVTQQPKNNFTVSALEKSAQVSMKLKNYEVALASYKRLENEDRFYTYTLPRTQDYLIAVAVPSGTAQYVLAIAVSPLP